MTSSNGNIFRVTGHFCGEFTGEFPAQRPVTRSFDIFFDLRLNKRLTNNREAGDLRRYRAHYDGCQCYDDMDMETLLRRIYIIVAWWCHMAT